MMKESEFWDTLKLNHPPKDLSPALKALWWDCRDDWEQAHAVAQDDPSRQGSWVHAYLHRKEGDQFNAGYWYSRAGQPRSKLSLEDERAEMIRALLNEHH